jgi:formate-dependent nitrite reductase membrane component NrfD
VGADLAKKPRAARALGAVTALLGGYLGSYTGVLLACTAVPVWARSRMVLGPIFVATATATGAAATRLTLVACGLPRDHPTRTGVETLEAAAMLAELSLSHLTERRLGDTAEVLRRGRAGLLFRAAKSLAVFGLSMRVAGRRAGPRAHDVASVAYLAAGLAFRYAWVDAGKASAHDDAAAAAMGRDRPTLSQEQSTLREPLPLPDPGRAYGAVIRRTSLVLERLFRRRGALTAGCGQARVPPR